MTPYSLPDVTPGGSKAQITSNANLRAVAVIFSAPAGNAAGIRVGDANVSATQGAIVNPGGPAVVFPRGAFDQQGYQLNQFYAYGTGGDVLTISYAQ